MVFVFIYYISLYNCTVYVFVYVYIIKFWLDESIGNIYHLIHSKFGPIKGL